MVGSALALAITAAAASVARGDWDHASFLQAKATPFWAPPWGKQPAKLSTAGASKESVGNLTESQRQVDRLVRELVPLQRQLGGRAGEQRKAELRLGALQDETQRVEAAFRPLREELRGLRAANKKARGSLRQGEAAASRSEAQGSGLEHFNYSRHVDKLASDLQTSIRVAQRSIADLSGQLKLEQPSAGAGQGTPPADVVAMTQRRQQRAASLEADLARSQEQHTKLEEETTAVRADFERSAREKRWLEDTVAKAAPDLQALQEERGRLDEESKRLHERLGGAQQWRASAISDAEGSAKSEAGQLERERARLASSKAALQGEIARLSGENKQAELADEKAVEVIKKADAALKQVAAVNQELKKDVAAATAEAQRLRRAAWVRQQ